MVATVAIEDEESESVFSIETRITTENMQIETGVMILMISSPSDSRIDVGFGEFWSIYWIFNELDGFGGYLDENQLRDRILR